MERYYKRKVMNESSSGIEEVGSDGGRDCSKKSREGTCLDFSLVDPRLREPMVEVGNVSGKDCLKNSGKEICLDDLPADPGLRKRIVEYDRKFHDDVRIAYLLRGPCQPRDHEFPRRQYGDKCRRFVPEWFDEFKPWLEYSVAKDAAFCLYCYLYRTDTNKPANGGAFVEGFSSWKKKESFRKHVGEINSAHNLARQKCQDLLSRSRSADVGFFKRSDQTWPEYRSRLLALIKCARFIVHQGWVFNVHDDPSNSGSEGRFLELLRFLADHNEDMRKAILETSLRNLKLTYLNIQKDITRALAVETTNSIVDDIGNGSFALLVSESYDASRKIHMLIILRYVDLRGCVIERFLGMVHVSDTSACTLAMAIDTLLSKHGLSTSRVRGQSYDGDSMQAEFEELKALIMNENGSAHCVHCFAHHLQLTLVIVAKKHLQVSFMYCTLLNLINVFKGSTKCKEILEEDQLQNVVDDLLNDALVIGQYLNVESNIQRAGDTRWDSHFSALLRLVSKFNSVIDTLQIVETSGALEKRGLAYGVLNSLKSFEFAFLLHLMKKIMGITDSLCETLRRKDQDIGKAMAILKVSKKEMLATRDEGWGSFLDEVQSFCLKHDIVIPNMNEKYVSSRRSRKHSEDITNLHHYKEELFRSVIDMQLKELNLRFNEVNSELLRCMACLNPDYSFSAYDKQKVIRLTEFYPTEFSEVEILKLNSELDTFIADVRSDSRYFELSCISDLAKKMVETKKDGTFPLVYMLLKLCLVLPVAAPTLERAFSATKMVKDKLRYQVGDSWMNDCLITYIEKDLSEKVENEKLMEQYQSMRKHQGKV